MLRNVVFFWSMRSRHITWYMPDVDTNVGSGSTINQQLFQTVEKHYVGVRDDHGAGVPEWTPGRSLHFRLEQEPESIL